MMTVLCIFIYYCHLNEGKPLISFMKLLFLHETGLVQSGKFREKEKIFREVSRKEGISDKIRKIFSWSDEI